MLDEVAQELDVARFRHLIGKLSRRLLAVDAASGLTPTQSSVLNAVVQFGRMGLTELSRIEGISPTMLSRSIATLESRRLVRRRVDEHDRRAASLEPTAAGTRLVRRLRDARSNVLRTEIDELAPPERQRLADAMPVLELLVDRLGRRS